MPVEFEIDTMPDWMASCRLSKFTSFTRSCNSSDRRSHAAGEAERFRDAYASRERGTVKDNAMDIHKFIVVVMLSALSGRPAATHSLHSNFQFTLALTSGVV